MRSPSMIDWTGLMPVVLGGLLAALSGILSTFLAESIRRRNTRDGVHRQMRTILRSITRSVRLAFSLFKNLQWNDSYQTYQLLRERIMQSDVAACLDNLEYDLLDNLVTELGRTIALVQLKEVKATEAFASREPEYHEKAAFRLYWAQAYRDVVPPLKAAVDHFGDIEMKNEVTKLDDEAAAAIARWEQILMPQVDFTLEEDADE